MAEIIIHIETSTPDNATKALDEIKQCIIFGYKRNSDDSSETEHWSMEVKGNYAK